MTLRKLLPLLLVCCSFVTAYAQKETQYIYLFDCTTSMKGYNGAPDIIGDAKKCLKEDIEQKTDHCDILFIPFQGNQPLQTLAFRRNQFKWDEVEARIDEVIDNPTNTDIVSAWDRAVKAFNPYAQNVLYLYTDGIDNVHGAAAVADMIRKWCVSAPDNVQAVYYMLTKASQNPEIEAAIKECTHIRVAKGLNDNPVVTTPGIVWRFDTGMDTVRAELDFTYRHSFAAKAVESSPYYDISVVGGKVEQGVAHLMAVKRVSDSELEKLPERLDFEITIVPASESHIDIINPTFPAEVTNRPVPAMQMLDNDNSRDLGDADYHPAFLFWSESEPAEVVCDLKARFNRHALAKHGSVTYLVTSDKGNDDFEVFYNGQPCRNRSFSVSADDKESVLRLVFHDDANTDKRHFFVQPKGASNMELVNGLPVNEYRMTLAADYDVNWHPMAHVFLWLGIILLAVSVLWFAVLRRVFFPQFRRVRQIKVTEPIFAVKKLKGVRKVIMTDRAPKKRQSALLRLFTGKVENFVNPAFFTTQIVAEPDGKTVRLRTAHTILCMPLNKLAAGQETELEDTESNKKLKIQIL